MGKRSEHTMLLPGLLGAEKPCQEKAFEKAGMATQDRGPASWDSPPERLFPVWAAFDIDMSGTAPVSSWSSILVARGQKEGATGCFVHTAGGSADQGWVQKHDPWTQPRAHT